MWILRYQYDLEDGDLKHVSCCLRLGKTYNIGRSGKNLLNIKNDKSISRQHIGIYCDNKDFKLKLVNQGKMTAVFGKYLKMGESVSFEKSKEIIFVELGTKPVKMQLQWMNSTWIVPQECLSHYSTLKQLGIELLPSELNRANLIVLDELRHHPLWLYGSVKGIPLMTLEFLNTVSEKISGHETQFDSIWDDIMNDRNVRHESFGVSAQVLNNLKFLILGKDEVTKSAIEAAGGKYSEVGCFKDLEEAIKKEEKTKDVVILRNHLTSADLLAPLGKSFTMQDVVEVILKDEVNSLKNGVVSEITERPKDEPPVEKPPSKKRRLNRPRVKPLDILSFFAGGDPMKESQEESTMKLSSQQDELNASKELRNTREEPEQFNEELKDLEVPKDLSGESKNLVEQSKQISKSVVSKQVTAETDKKPEQRLYNDLQANNTEKYRGKTTEPALQNTESIPPSAAETSNSTRPQRKLTLSNYRKGDNPSQNDMIQMIQDTKNSEVRRLNSTIIQVGDEELTEDAINQLGNLALVDQNDNLMRRRDQSPTVDSHNPDWNNRKNFKKFIKIWPRYGGQESTTREGSSDTIRNRALLLTRKYVPTRTYTSDDSSKKTSEDLYDFPNPQPEEPTEPQVEAPGPNNLFVMDDDDSQDIVLEEPEKPIPPASHFIDDKDSNSDSDDDEPKFQFKRRKR